MLMLTVEKNAFDKNKHSLTLAHKSQKSVQLKNFFSFFLIILLLCTQKLPSYIIQRHRATIQARFACANLWKQQHFTTMHFLVFHTEVFVSLMHAARWIRPLANRILTSQLCNSS